MTLAKRRFGKRKIGGDLEFNRGVTVQKVNEEIKDLGYQMRFAGWDEYDWAYYTFMPTGKAKRKLKVPSERVYAIGDYTVKEWKSLLYRKLKETNPKWLKLAIEKQRLARRKREREAESANS